jgi:arabinogalactan endo-1,4-beta-galactosidase
MPEVYGEKDRPRKLSLFASESSVLSGIYVIGAGFARSFFAFFEKIFQNPVLYDIISSVYYTFFPDVLSWKKSYCVF